LSRDISIDLSPPPFDDIPDQVAADLRKQADRLEAAARDGKEVAREVKNVLKLDRAAAVRVIDGIFARGVEHNCMKMKNKLAGAEAMDEDLDMEGMKAKLCSMGEILCDHVVVKFTKELFGDVYERFVQRLDKCHEEHRLWLENKANWSDLWLENKANWKKDFNLWLANVIEECIQWLANARAELAAKYGIVL